MSLLTGDEKTGSRNVPKGMCRAWMLAEMSRALLSQPQHKIASARADEQRQYRYRSRTSTWMHVRLRWFLSRSRGCLEKLELIAQRPLGRFASRQVVTRSDFLQPLSNDFRILAGQIRVLLETLAVAPQQVRKSFG